MESVKRFKFKGADYVYAADFDRVTAEREALQLMLNDLEEQNHSLEQRRYAEQQAREAAERRVEALEGLLRRVIESSVLSFEMDAPEELEALEVDICATLNPTAEAVSHE